jgi:hypothetical protein
MAANSRQRGNTYERLIVNEIKALGFDAVTSRAESRNMDARKVDVFSPEGSTNPLPIYIQTKNMKDNFKVADYYRENKQFFPKDKPLVIFHKKTKKAITKFITEGEFVYMEKESFYELLKKMK